MACATHNLAASCRSAYPSFPPASLWESRRLFWADDYFAIVLGGTEEGAGQHSRTSFQTGDTTTSFARDLTAGVKW